LATILQLAPSQCSTRVLLLLLLPCNKPTAQTSFVVIAVTAISRPFEPGLETTLQAVPSKCSVNDVVLVFVIFPRPPTVQISLEEMAVIPKRKELPTP